MPYIVLVIRNFLWHAADSIHIGSILLTTSWYSFVEKKKKRKNREKCCPITFAISHQSPFLSFILKSNSYDCNNNLILLLLYFIPFRIYDWDNFHFVCELSLFFFYLIITIILLRHAVIFQLYLEPDRKSSDTISASLYSIELHLSLTEWW